MTDSAGTLAEPEARAGDEGAGDSGPPADGGGPARPRRRWRWLRWAALATALVLLAAAGTAWWFYRQLDAEITTDTTTAVELRTYERERPRPVVHDARNILVLGSDTRSGENGKYGRDDGTRRADTTILLHIAADRRSATAMSLPRDLMAEIPSCRRDDGSRTTAQFAQFNSAFAIGGAACTIRTVEKMTGIRIDHHVIVDFLGFEKMVDAVDGVEVCLPRPVDDREARLRLDEGKQTLNGEEALGYVRARKSLGDGSDTERMERQQQFLGSLVKKVQSNGVLLNPTRLYPVLKAATSSLTTDPGLDSLKDLYDLTRSLQGIPTEKVQFLTVPRQPWVADINRDELVQPDAGRLFRQLRDDKPVTVVPRGAGDATGPGTGGDGQNAPGTPGAPSAAPGAPSAAPGGPGTPGPVDRADPAGGEGEQNAGSAGKAESGRGGERNPGASPAPSASAESSPTFTGTNAAVGVCE
ncbi:LCP family protein [Streptomyces yaizuensis]|uniref:LCP family protein n=1 Tax=Streptomyces yaizuensis TaxID=2989713 RepID=A0ABQ5P9J0_9ACTN|nr:LCP family protein [Streptomyces sp. YSPA8]